ncbi:peptidyl-prolyl cis-trans isomerase [Robertkochia sediminum]|uniref:peptidyl-prolyl cis-trans isomerase n=1 Tax=Robertkochia sediminum TaxID=2785326 RepID=UPI00193228A7|nr:peptidyl-prolyl cis-trans isomerase [Robertkochia sediminum]MBL7472532.1 peptidyl-prolyl cis-trans isomerase [Robertkochia sediminum]
MKKIRKYGTLVAAVAAAIAQTACNYIATPDAEGAVARVDEHYLLRSELDPAYNGALSPEDSMVVVNNYINEWAKDQLLFEKAQINLSEEKQEAFERLVTQYRADLYINAYKEALVNKGMDTAVSRQELETYYEANKNNFMLNEDLVRLRYISLPVDFTGQGDIADALKRFGEDDVQQLQERALKFKFYSLNDSAWVRVSEVVRKIPVLTVDNKDDYLKKSQFFELSDSLGVYLVAVEDVLKRTETPPLDYVEPTIKKILLNKRKLEYIRKLEEELLDEATRDKVFEVYIK